MLILGDQHYYKSESLNVEFKEFCLDVSHDSLNIDDICKTGIIKYNEIDVFNKLILNNIEKYFIKYIPRYMSAFINSNIDNAELLIGVDDFGEITGIPFFGTFEDFNLFINLIIDLPLTYLKTDGKEIDYKVIVEELTIDENYLSDETDEILKDFHYHKNKINILHKKYKKERVKWSNTMNSFTCKLPILLETKKIEFNQYLIQYAPHLVNYKIYEHEMSGIADLKTNPEHYLYWLMQYKKHHINELKKIKPRKPTLPKIIYGPEYLMNNLTDLRFKFVKNNKNIKYFIIKIIFPNNSNQYNPIYYYDDSNRLVLKKRLFHDIAGPCCL